MGTKFLKWVTWPDHAHFRGELCFPGQPLIWTTCVQNLKTRASETTVPGRVALFAWSYVQPFW